MELSPGTVLLDKYRVDEVIGTGGMGRVIRATHLYLHQPVAIKIMLPELAQNPDTVARFLREAQANVRLRSEHIVRVLDVGTLSSGVPFMVMEFLEGSDLSQVLVHHGPQLPNVVCDLMLQACEGMAEAHSLGIIHRDIKPSNFFVTQRPDGSLLLKILDFGISKTAVNVTDLTGTQTVMGTPTYMAPEQMKSGKRADARSDVWSIGIVMYQLVQGQPPFAGETYADLVIKVGTEAPMPLHVPLPPGLGDVIMRCLARDPAERHQNVGELARLLAPFATDPISAAMISGRATRILDGRGSQPALPGSLGAPLHPAALTPPAWRPPSHTSVSQSKGEVMPMHRRLPSWAIAGMVALSGLGGYVLSSVTHEPSIERRDEPYVQAPPVAKPTTSPVVPAAQPSTPPSPPKPAPVASPDLAVTPPADAHPADASAPSDPSDPPAIDLTVDATDPKSGRRSSRTKSDRRASRPKTDPKSDAKSEKPRKPDDPRSDAKSDAKPHKPDEPTSDDLFDSRH
ncbi:MAG: protein kinase [Kofleriaceae bacterium]